MEGASARSIATAEPARSRRATGPCDGWPVLPPEAVRRALPASAEALETVRTARERLFALRDGQPRVAVVGPGSIHDPEAALDYARRLRRLADELDGELVLLMRTCVEAPRRSSDGGWPGLVADPQLDGSCDRGLGLAIARRLLLHINEVGVPCASEPLAAATAPYLDDLLAWHLPAGGAAPRVPEGRGVMLASFLGPGRQDLGAGRRLRYGVSVTDACLGFHETARRLRAIATAGGPAAQPQPPMPKGR